MAIITVGLALMAGSTATAQYYEWSNPQAGAYYDASNWWSIDAGTSTVVPGSADSAFFSLNQSSPHTVTLSADAQLDALMVRNDQVAFDLGGHTLTLNRTTDHLASIVVGESDGQRGDLFLTGGALQSQIATIGYREGSTGAVTVNGADWLNQQFMQVGSSGTGSLSITGGGYVEANRASVGSRYGLPQPWEPPRSDNTGNFYLEYITWAANFGATPDPPPPPPLRENDLAGASAVATVTIDGPQSTWHVKNNLYVGPRLAWESNSYKSIVETTGGGRLSVGRLLQFTSRLGVLDVTGGRAVVGNDSESFDQSGTLYVGTGGRVNGGGYVDGNVVVAGGTIVAGRDRQDTTANEPLVISGDLTLDANSLLSVGILPRFSGPLIDGVQIRGTAELAGTLLVDIGERVNYGTGELIHFDPMLGAKLPILEYDSFTGFFDDVVISGWESNQHRLVPVYGDDTLALIVSTIVDGDATDDGIVDGNDFIAWASAFGESDTQPFDPYSAPYREDGDYNDDGVINGLDYEVWRDLVGQYSVPADMNVTLGAGRGDFNHDGIVDGNDYLIWAGNYGTQAEVATSGSEATPEPATALLAALGVAVVTMLPRRRRVR